jgi:nucleotide-binding universal stress UspA family protein
MEKDKMVDVLVCMVRSGSGGRAAQRQSINMALRDNSRLIFLHVINTGDLVLENESLCDAAREEMTWIGNMTLNLVRKQAWAAGVQAETAIRYGSVFDEACKFLREVDADHLLIGSPHPKVENYELRLTKVQDFAGRLANETGVTAEVVEN